MKLFAKYFCKSALSMKSNIIILFLLSLLSSFMYFFVQISIDGNLEYLNSKPVLTNVEKEFLVSLQSNQTLAITFLVMLTLITTFVYFMFYKKYCSLHQKELGCYIALGYSTKKMALIILLISIILNFIANICGLCLGWIGSEVMLGLYNDVYSLKYLVKGIYIQNYSIALLSSFLPAISVMMICEKMNKEDTIDFLNANNNMNTFHMGMFSRILSRISSFSMRLALRKPFQIFISIFSVGIFTILFIMSFSLNLSSQYSFDTQSHGRNYQYDVSYPVYQTKYKDYEKSEYYIKENIKIESKDKKINGSIMGIENSKDLFFLTDKRGSQIKNIPTNNVVVSEALAVLYDIQKGTDIAVRLNNIKISLRVYDIAQNADNYSIYISKINLEKLLNLSQNSYNGIYTNNITEIPKMGTANIQNISERIAKLEENNVSNRTSAVICQVLGCVIGCLLLYLTILLKFQEDTKNIFILDMMGYTAKKINKMFISVYRPILNIAFIILLIPSIEICKLIHKSLSLSTNDYIPFQCNIFVILFIFILLNLLYTIIKLLFNSRISHIQKKDIALRYLN